MGLLVFLAVFLLARGYIPSGDELVDLFNGLYAKYGFEILILSAFLEALFIINLFVPGQVSLALGIIFAKTHGRNLEVVILAACTGAILGYILDYLVGFLGLSSAMEKRGFKNQISRAIDVVDKTSNFKLSLGFIHPNLASFIAFGMGAVKTNFWQFLLVTVLATFLFVTFWSVLIYIFSEIIINIIRRYIYFGVVIILAISIFRNLQKRKEK
jgi:membrane protein DedA with SNARE-associated domain